MVPNGARRGIAVRYAHRVSHAPDDVLFLSWNSRNLELMREHGSAGTSTPRTVTRDDLAVGAGYPVDILAGYAELLGGPVPVLAEVPDRAENVLAYDIFELPRGERPSGRCGDRPS